MIWDAHRYGFGSIYWVTISGVPVVWTERATGLSLPTGFATEDASLVIDDSADVGIEQIDRDRGVAASLALGFRLLDTTTARDWLRRWSDQATLTAQLNVAGTTVTVDSTTGWPAAGELHLGMERITYTGTTPTTFTGGTRATAGSLAYQHRPGTTAQIVTDRPRFWRGRDVVLWASPVDASGAVAGSALTDDAVQVWRGRITTGPHREVDGFAFEAEALDRVLDRELATSITGAVTDTSVKYEVKPGCTITIAIEALGAGAQVWAYVLDLTPFTALSTGDLLTADEMRDYIIDAFDDAVTAAGAGGDLGSMQWKADGPTFTCKVFVQANAGADKLNLWVSIDGVDYPAGEGPSYPGSSLPDLWASLWQAAGDPTHPDWQGAPAGLSSLTIHVDDGDPHDVPDTGLVWLEGQGVRYPFIYGYTALDGIDLYLGGVVQGSYGAALPLTPAQAVGMQATIQLVTAGTFPEVMLTTLECSGTGVRGTYDTGARGRGYGIDDAAISETSFTGAAAPLGALSGTLVADGGSFGDRLGGALGLFRQAVVCRADTSATYRAQKLTLVQTAPYGSGWTVTIGDEDLLSHEGDPVVSVRRADSATVVEVVRKVADTEDRLVVTDRDQVDAVGRRAVTYEVPADDRQALLLAAAPAVASHFAADQTAQAVEIRVPPWILAEVGDVVRLQTTHPAIWTWDASPGEVGYDGPARVVGRRISLRSSVVTLTLLIGGGVRVQALSPAMEVQAFDVAGLPTWIDVPLIYLPHMSTALTQAGANVHLLHYYGTGVESDSEGYEVSAAAESGGLCRLTIAGLDGAPVLSLASESYLTLPTSTGGDLTTYQGEFAHIDDGTQWG